MKRFQTQKEKLSYFMILREIDVTFENHNFVRGRLQIEKIKL